LHDVALIIAERDRDLPCVLIDSEIQHGRFSCRVMGRKSDTSPYPMGEPILLDGHSFIDSNARKTCEVSSYGASPYWTRYDSASAHSIM
jgi:hypothetical protein